MPPRRVKRAYTDSASRPAAPPDVDEDPLDAMLVESGMPAERHEIAQQSRAIDARPAIVDLHARVVGLSGHRAHRAEESREQRLAAHRHRRATQRFGRGVVAIDRDRQRIDADAGELGDAAAPRSRAGGSSVTSTARADRVPRVARERRGNVGAASEARQVESGEIELDRLRLDEPRRVGGHGERRDRHLRLARRGRARSARRRSTDRRRRTAARRRIRARALRRALDREQQPGVVAFRVRRGAAERRVARSSCCASSLARAFASARRRSLTRADAARRAARASPRSARSRGRGDRCGRSSSRLPPSGRR